MNTLQLLAAKVAELKQLIDQVQDPSLQQALQVPTERLLKTIFDHCIHDLQHQVLEQRVMAAKVKFPSLSKQSVPSLADSAIRHKNQEGSVF